MGNERSCPSDHDRRGSGRQNDISATIPNDISATIPNDIFTTISDDQLDTYQKAAKAVGHFSIVNTSDRTSQGYPVSPGRISIQVRNYSEKDRSFSEFWNKANELKDQG